MWKHWKALTPKRRRCNSRELNRLTEAELQSETLCAAVGASLCVGIHQKKAVDLIIVLQLDVIILVVWFGNV